MGMSPSFVLLYQTGLRPLQLKLSGLRGRSSPSQSSSECPPSRIIDLAAPSHAFSILERMSSSLYWVPAQISPSAD